MKTNFSTAARKDLRRIGPGVELTRILDHIELVFGGATITANADITSVGAPWSRLRVGDYRVLFRLSPSRAAGSSDLEVLIARVVHRSELQRVLGHLLT